MTLNYGREIRVPETARGLEFLMAESRAYCSSTAGGNTRKYHGLFVHTGRVYLAGFDEIVNGVRIASQQYEGGSDDSGLACLHAFSLYPPVWTFFIGDVIVQKTVAFSAGTVISYDITGEADILIRPLLTDRSVDEVCCDKRPKCTSDRSRVRWGPCTLESDLPYKENPVMYRNLLYERERERGYDHVEDLFSPGCFRGRICNGSFTLHCSGPENQPLQYVQPGITPSSPASWLDWASAAFCHGDEIHAGYHWFRESWGRDSAISVNGLLIERDRKAEAQVVLLKLARSMKDGVIPNRFPDNYHTSDASLWFVHAVGRYRRRWGDDSFVAGMHPFIEEIMECYPSSSVATLDHSLITVARQSTWMDTVYTPREGKPVEINALWISALAEAESMGIQVPVQVRSAKEVFVSFWNDELQCLYDCIDPPDPSVRPNQVIALALGLVDQQQASAALSVIKKTLLTPYGLRTLSPHDPVYQGRFSGDRSYHNGCVWPWLTGWFVEALLQTGTDREMIAPMLSPILNHVREAGAGYISEIFDGDPPYRPQGCIAQAWSVAEISRACRMVIRNP